VISLPLFPRGLTVLKKDITLISSSTTSHLLALSSEGSSLLALSTIILDLFD
jgi:hypothetical protein